MLDSIGFVDTTWIGRGGYFHSDKMHIVEKFKREGDAIFYDLTLEDPEVLAEPLVFPTRVLRRSAGANAGLIAERGNCETIRNRSGRLTDSGIRRSERSGQSRTPPTPRTRERIQGRGPCRRRHD